ncbi:hypothetical protein ADUPG1_010616, partial [Aduncisulcus paluster]
RGRLEYEIVVQPPDSTERFNLLQLLLKNKTHSISVEDLQMAADRCVGFVGADIEAAMRYAVLALVKEARKHEISVCETSYVDQIKNSLRIDHLLLGIASVTPAALRSSLSISSSGSWDDIGGYSDLKIALRKSVDPDYLRTLQSHGLPPSNGVFLYGPPGCAKTMLARALAGEVGSSFLAVNSTQLLSPYVGETEERIRDVFERAKGLSPCVLFLDEVDSLCGIDKETPAIARACSTVLLEIDKCASERQDCEAVTESGAGKLSLSACSGIHEESSKKKSSYAKKPTSSIQVFVVCATNTPWNVDRALFSAGRVGTSVLVSPPGVEERQEIVEKQLGDSLSGVICDVSLRNKIIHVCDGYTGAELVAVCTHACLSASKRELCEVSVEKDGRISFNVFVRILPWEHIEVLVVGINIVLIDQNLSLFCFIDSLKLSCSSRLAAHALYKI